MSLMPVAVSEPVKAGRSPAPSHTLPKVASMSASISANGTAIVKSMSSPASGATPPCQLSPLDILLSAPAPVHFLPVRPV